MGQRKLDWYVVVLSLTSTMFQISFTEVYTSSKKIEDMVLQEQHILSQLQEAVTELGNETASLLFSKFYKDRMLKAEQRQRTTLAQENLSHPNGIYFCIKHFAADYENIRSVLDKTPSWWVQKHLSLVADQTDVRGARMSFLRLQSVYNISTSDMVKGNYFGRSGPELSQEDVMEIGRVALDGGNVGIAIEWLEAALQQNNREPTVGLDHLDFGTSLTGQIHALLGRAYNHQGNHQKAMEMYKRAVSADPNKAYVKQLERELESRPNLEEPYERPYQEDFRRLCRLQNKLTKAKFDRRLNCTYRHVLLPYYRFKMELISVSPYVALFFDVITDEEINGLKNYVTNKLERGALFFNGKIINKETRTSDTSFVRDEECPIAGGLSKRVGAISRLDASHSNPDQFFSSDPFQIVNYGMGGHYDVHMDSFQQKELNKKKTFFAAGDNRLATFLIYLSDVEKGGTTAFPLADIAVSPVKKMALFWYNFTPSGKTDLLTYHAACPVVFGQKWVTNKWIYLHANMFNRRCGLKKTATQLDIDQYMVHGWS